MSQTTQWTLVSLWIVLCPIQSANAGLVEFWNDAPGWQATVSHYEFVDFTGFPAGTFVTTQFSGFTVTSASIFHNAEGYSDGWGMWSPNGVTIEFDIPLFALAVDHLGVVQFDLFYQGEYITTTSEFDYAVPGGPFFSGFVSDIAFDEVYVFRPMPPFSSNVIALDNLYWGIPIPSPGALSLLGLAMLTIRRRCRAS